MISMWLLNKFTSQSSPVLNFQHYWEKLVTPTSLNTFNFSISSATQSCLTLCNSMACSTPGSPVHHQFPEPAQTHIHQVGDAIQPSHPLSSPSPPAFINLSSIGIFSNESVLYIMWPKYWSFSFSIRSSSEYSGLISFRLDWLDLLEVQGALKNLLQYHSSKS